LKAPAAELKTMTTEADELRANLEARIMDEALADPRVKALERWALQKPDDELADAIELFMIGLDASRKSRWVVLRTIDDEFRSADELLPHAERVAFLRWIVRCRETDSKIQAKLRELREAATPQARSRIIDAISATEGPNTPSLENAHSVFVFAWRAALPDARPIGAVHRGEPEPLIGARNTVGLVIWCARRVAHLVPKSEKKAFDRLLVLAMTAVAAGRSNAPLHAAVERASSKGAMSLARSACMEARASLERPDMTGIAARPAAARAVSVLLEAEGKDAVRSFLRDLDEELRRLDVVHAVDGRKKSPSRPIVRAIHRAAEDGKVVLWLAALEGGQLGLLSKQGRLWTWSEGSRDDVLAMIPDAHFERAVMAQKSSSSAEADDT
jgi:hypothetical protein